MTDASSPKKVHERLLTSGRMLYLYGILTELEWTRFKGRIRARFPELYPGATRSLPRKRGSK